MNYKVPYLIEYEAELKKASEMTREMKNEGIEISHIAKISGLTDMMNYSHE